MELYTSQRCLLMEVWALILATTPELTMELDTVMLNALLMSSLLMENLTLMAGATRPLVVNMVPAVLRWTYGKLTRSPRLSLLILALWKDKKDARVKIVALFLYVTKLDVTLALTVLEYRNSSDLVLTTPSTLPSLSLLLPNSSLKMGLTTLM